MSTELFKKFTDEWMSARKAGIAGDSQSRIKALFFSGVISEVRNHAMESKREPTDEDLIYIAKKTAKSLSESKAKALEANATPAQVEYYDFALEVLKPYLPAVVSKETTEQSVMAAIMVGGAKTIGEVMRYIKVNKLPADMKIASEIARSILAG